MAVTNAYAPVREQGNGVKTAFDFTFKIFNDSDLVVGKLLRSTEVETACTLGVDYTVTINAVTEGGTVTYAVAPTALQDSFIRRAIPQTQPEVIPSSNIFREAQLNNALDRAVMLVQQLWTAIGRCIKLPETWTGGDVSIPAPEAGKFLVGNATEDGFENADLPDPSILVKAETADAEAGTDDAKFMTPAKVKSALEKSGLYTTPIANVPIITGAKGGTGADLSAAAKGAVPFFNSAGVMAALAAGVLGKVLTAGGAGANPSWDDAIKPKVGEINREMDAATGDVSYTGIGFAPKLVVFFSAAAAAGSDAGSWGFSDGITSRCISRVTGSTLLVPYNAVVHLKTGATPDSQAAVLKTMDADGFTLTWTKLGAPSAGTSYAYFIAI